ncbi:MAG: MCE family protein [Acidobacteria bacterium]|nr:MCE family protein [Acidobacteriota bacterium]MBI3264379.1 MCE family protein [Acidobacteriota bacterium]
MPSARAIGTGAFILIGLLLFAVALFMIGERRMLFAKKFEVYAEFSRLSGLQQGAPVRVAGMMAGEVKDIQVPPGPDSKFRVRLQIRDDLHPLVRTDSVATIQTEGLVGGMFVQVGAGTNQAPPAPAESIIGSREPYSFADLLQQASETVTKISEAVTDLKEGMDTALGQVSDTVQDADRLIKDVGADVKQITASGTKVAADTQVIVEGLRAGRGTLGKLINDDTLYLRAQHIAEQAEEIAKNVREATVEFKDLGREGKEAIATFRSEQGPIVGAAADVRQTLKLAREALENLADNTEALKRNWFFRGFFRDRGFYDLNRISPADYRQGALETKTRKALRIWLAADQLFELSTRAAEPALSPAGAATVESAMAGFLQYKPGAILIVEGYATSGFSNDQYLASKRRAQVVRDYLVQKFDLESRFVAAMPLSAEAMGRSPAGDRWDGIALTLYVEKTALRAATADGSKNR